MKNSIGLWSAEVAAEIKQTKSDEFQSRYLAHQSHPGGKRDELIALMKERHSNRRFDDRQLEQKDLDTVLDALRHCPSSCDRFGVRVNIIQDRDSKTLLNGLLVGATGWLYRAPTVLMLWGNPEAYKGGDNGDEVNYNAPIDAGVMAQTAMLAATSVGLHTTYCNPQVRVNNREFFKERFKPKTWDDAIFYGAVALGYPHKDRLIKSRRLIDTVVVE